MAGRKLRRARNAAIEALTDAQAVAIARDALANLNDSQVLAVLVAEPASRGTTPQSMPEVRQAVGDLLATHPDSARAVIALCADRPNVERALGITRTPGQQHR